ncbi:alpha/beta hydrolase fold domain-containing protein [Amycolatopsis sp. NBC_00355]|uniref:alpha/beta hydrolase fold domain-containing protein n=1 Tax=Amycolatopsis sp. NBC_00355 TaxID=2975957 RepID=UPI003FA44F4A
MRAEYRLGPETRAPGAAEDGYLAYTHLAGHAAELRIGPAGASSGGAPAAALMGATGGRRSRLAVPAPPDAGRPARDAVVLREQRRSRPHPRGHRPGWGRGPG